MVGNTGKKSPRQFIKGIKIIMLDHVVAVLTCYEIQQMSAGIFPDLSASEKGVGTGVLCLCLH